MKTKFYIVQTESLTQSDKWFYVGQVDTIKEGEEMIELNQPHTGGKYRIIKRTIKDEVVKL